MTDVDDRMDELISLAETVVARNWTPEVDEKLSLVGAIKSALHLVQEKGYGYVYQRPQIEAALGGMIPGACMNWHIQEDVPGCVVGHILFRFGVHKMELQGQNSAPAEDFATHYASDHVAFFLRALQERQDRGVSWGEALLQTLNDVGSNGAFRGAHD